MTTSPKTASLDHPRLRRLVEQADRLSVAERVTLLKALIPGTADLLSPREFGALIAELELKGERFYEALEHPGEGRATRLVAGERELEGR